MKIVFATGIFPPDIGGPATSVSMLSEAWSAEGHPVTVVTYSDVEDEIESRPYEVVRIPRSLPAWKRAWSFFMAVRRSLAAAGAVFAQDAGPSGLPALLAARLAGRRFIVKIVGDYAWEQAQVRDRYDGTLDEFQRDWAVSPRAHLARLVQKIVARSADRVIVPSRYLAGVVKGWGVREERVRVVYNGVHPVERQPCTVHGARCTVNGCRPHRVIAAGRLVPWKKLDVLIKAMATVLQRVPEATLTIVGDGPELGRLKALASAPMLRGKVEFRGRLPRRELCRLVADSGVFVLPSSYEGFSHQLVEAFMCGTPVVASRAGGNVELVEDGRNGLLVRTDDASGTAAAVVRMLTDRPFAEACAKAAKGDLGRFTVEAQIRGTRELVFGTQGLRVVLVSRDGTAADPSSRTAERMRLYGSRVDKLHVVALGRGDAAMVRLTENVTVERVDVRRTLRAPFAALAAVRQGVRDVDATLVVAQDPFEAGLAAWRAARAARVPLLVEEHGGVFLSTHWREESLKNRALHPLGLRVLAAADGVRAVSAKIEADLSARFPRAKITRIPVYTEPRKVRSEAPPDAFGFVGRFVAQKDLPLLLHAFRIVASADPRARLLMVGAGPLEASLRVLAAELTIGDRVAWIPHAENVDAAYARIGTLVLPSLYEGWGRVVAEAMSCGIPTVMTDVGCANELMRNGVEGYVVPVGARDALAKAMLAAADPWQHKLMAAAALRRAESLATPEALADRLICFWREVAGT